MENEGIKTIRGELGLLLVVMTNSLGVVMMLYSGSGISAISSVPYAIAEVWPILSLGTWTYIFHGALVFALMLLRKKFVPQYLLSFVVGFVFGVLIDVHKSWVMLLPQTIPLRIAYFFISYFLLCFGIAISNRCKMPVIPTDLFPRELTEIIKVPYPKVKVSFDMLCVATTAILTFVFLGGIRGLGIGTIAAALTMGKTIGLIGSRMDLKVKFVSIFSPKVEQDVR